MNTDPSLLQPILAMVVQATFTNTMIKAGLSVSQSFGGNSLVFQVIITSMQSLETKIMARIGTGKLLLFHGAVSTFE